MNKEETANYELTVWDWSVSTASTFGTDTKGMKKFLIEAGATEEEISVVTEEQKSEHYEKIWFRGKNIDEGVYEALKEIARRINNF